MLSSFFLKPDNVSGDLLSYASDLVYQVSALRQAFIGDTSSLASLSLQEKLGIHRGPMSDYAHRSAYCLIGRGKLCNEAKLRNT